MAQATILLVDDDVTALARLSDLLTDAGYEAVKANDLTHAMTLCAEHNPSLVLLEVGAEHGAGWQLVAQFAPIVPVIVVSRHGLEEDVVRGFDSGATDYITKPFRSAEVLARVRVRLTPRQAVPLPPAPTPEVTHATLKASNAAPDDSDAAPDTNATQPELPPPPQPIKTSASAERVARREAAGPVVMSYADEHALLESEPQVRTAPQEVSPDLALGPRLHAARLQRRVTLVQAENELNIRMYYLQAIEEEKFTLLPGVVLSESYLQKYATFLGQDPKRAVDEYRRLHYTVPGSPLPALGGQVTRRAVPPWVVWLLAIVLAVAVSAGALFTLDPAGATNILHTLRNLVP